MEQSTKSDEKSLYTENTHHTEKSMKLAEKELYKEAKSHPSFKAGDILKVSLREMDGSKERIKLFEGVVIRLRGDSIGNKTFTIRKVAHGISAVYTLPLYSPKIAEIKVQQRSKVRRSRIYYLLERKGNKAKMKRAKITKK